eukprot:Sspe_Gene.93346::Locus_66015_Transcript_6_6_Confidence_0.333_Length_1163::g.93346::m.93346
MGATLRDLCGVWEVQTMGKSNDSEARRILDSIASDVKPVMAKRGWKVSSLREFLPRDPRLLGVNINHGHRICLRLRPARAPSSFLKYDSILCTMLHELAHIVHGPHNAAFYRLYEELKAEMEEILAARTRGATTPSASSSWRNRSVTDNVRDAAVRRAPGRKVGGDSTLMKSFSPAEMAAQAAIRRSEDREWCATQEVPIRGGWECMLCTLVNPLGEEKCAACGSPARDRVRKRDALPSSPGDTNICHMCTYENPTGDTHCAMCSAPLGGKIRRKTVVSCPRCTLHNPLGAVACTACSSPLRPPSPIVVD